MYVLCNKYIKILPSWVWCNIHIKGVVIMAVKMFYIILEKSKKTGFYMKKLHCKRSIRLRVTMLQTETHTHRHRFENDYTPFLRQEVKKTI